ncbi:hypothetical protein ACMFMF_005312 [Clarireedia jacksonii]
MMGWMMDEAQMVKVVSWVVMWWLCGYVVMWLCGYVVMWLCGYVVMWLCGYVLYSTLLYGKSAEMDPMGTGDQGPAASNTDPAMLLDIWTGPVRTRTSDEMSNTFVNHER